MILTTELIQVVYKVCILITILGQDIAGSVDSIEKITVKDLKDNFDCFYKPANCHLVLVGDFDVEDIYTFVNEKQSEFTLPESIS